MSSEKPTQGNSGKVTEGFNALSIERSAEMASVAVAAAAKAEVEAAFVMALRQPRNEEDARARILSACRNPIFAQKARYAKPVGKKEVAPGRWEQQYIVGPSIRFAEEMLRAWKNVHTQMTTIYDDLTKRIVKVTVRDLESNLTYSKEISLDKAVERRNPADREVLGQRVNSENKIVYIVKATEDELAIKEAAQVSKVIRNSGLRLIPQHITEEAMQEVERMIRDRVQKDPDAEKRALLDGFARRGVMPSELEKYLGMPPAQWGAEQVVTLRDLLTAIEEGVATWREVLEGTAAEGGVEMEAKSQPATKGAAILDKIGKPETMPKAEPEPKPEPKPENQEAEKPKAAPKPPTTEVEPDQIDDMRWNDILTYLDDAPDRAVLKKQVREKGNWGNLLKLHPTKRPAFLRSLQDAAKAQNIEMQRLI